jgi:uroporphyrin-3 C-methyltransferase
MSSPSPASEPQSAEGRPPAASAAPRVARSTLVVAALALVCVAALALAWSAQQRVRALEQALVKRQIDSAALAAQAQLISQQAQDTSRDSAAKVALLQARVAELASQRLQLDELIASLSRSRGDALLADIESALRVAMQQAEITASVGPLVITLKQIDERLARLDDPALDSLRRAVALDLERMRGAGAVDVAALVGRLDEAARAIDELPLLVAPQPRGAARGTAPRAAASASAGASASAPATDAGRGNGVDNASVSSVGSAWAALGGLVWSEVRGLVRVTRIDQPEAMLLAPEQAYFLRENLKLRLLNARLALLSRQFDTARIDLRDAQQSLERYFDRNARRVGTTLELLRQTAARAEQVAVPRPEATLTALAAAAASR